MIKKVAFVYIYTLALTSSINKKNDTLYQVDIFCFKAKVKKWEDKFTFEKQNSVC